MHDWRSVLLTGDVGGGLEGAKDVGVHLDAHVTLFNELLVARIHNSLHPVGEGLAHQRVGHVDDPLAGELADVVRLREVLGCVRVLGCLRQELLDAEPLVLWHGQVLDTVAVKKLFGAHDQRLEEVDCDVLVGRQERAALNGGEVIPEEKVS